MVFAVVSPQEGGYYMGAEDDNMRLESLVVEFREMLPAQCETARAIDRHESFESIALKAIADGYIEFSQQFAQFMETCLRRNG
jgi:hypothetical protein